MKKQTLIILLLVLASVIFGCVQYHKAAKENQISLALAQEKENQYHKLIANAINTLEAYIQDFEQKSGLKPSVIVAENQLPSVFRHRLGLPVYRGESMDLLLRQVNGAIEKVILALYVIDGYPDTPQNELLILFSSIRSRGTTKDLEIVDSALRDFNRFLSAQNSEISRIKRMGLTEVKLAE